jgi:hypothetical protein
MHFHGLLAAGDALSPTQTQRTILQQIQHRSHSTTAAMKSAATLLRPPPLSACIQPPLTPPSHTEPYPASRSCRSMAACCTGEHPPLSQQLHQQNPKASQHLPHTVTTTYLPVGPWAACCAGERRGRWWQTWTLQEHTASHKTHTTTSQQYHNAPAINTSTHSGMGSTGWGWMWRVVGCGAVLACMQATSRRAHPSLHALVGCTHRAWVVGQLPAAARDRKNNRQQAALLNHSRCQNTHLTVQYA